MGFDGVLFGLLEWLSAFELDSWLGVLASTSPDSLDFPVTNTGKQGGIEVVDSYMLEHFVRTKQNVFNNYVPLVGAARALAGLTATLYLFWKIYSITLKVETEWQLLPLLRPFAISLILSLWPQFAHIIVEPGQQVGHYARYNYWKKAHDLDSLYRRRVVLIDSLWTANATDLQATMQQEALRKKDPDAFSRMLSTASSVLNGTLIREGLEDMFQTGFRKIAGLQGHVMYWFRRIAGYIAQVVFNAAIALILLTEVILICTLYVVGPISMAFSLVPGFGSSFLYWVRQMVCVSFYTCIAYLIIYMGMAFLEYAYFREVFYLRMMVDNKAALLLYLGGTQSVHGSLIIMIYSITAIGILTTPIMATYVVDSAAGGAVLLGSQLLKKLISPLSGVAKMAKVAMMGR